MSLPRKAKLDWAILLSCALFLTSTLFASQNLSPAEAYLMRFNAFSQWSNHLPTEPNKAFLSFIDTNAPFGKKLRERWLYALASRKDWVNFKSYYRPSDDRTLQCFYHRADYHLGNTEQALKAAKEFWLSPESSPVACVPLLELLIKSPQFDENWIGIRIGMALDNDKIGLARYLLSRYKVPRKNDLALLNKIHQDPAKIKELRPGPLHDIFYLYGLKRLVATRRHEAIRLWQSPLTKIMLSPGKQQQFIAYMALHQALNSQKDADTWFMQLKPAYYDDTLLEWKIRMALKQGLWHRIEALTQNIKNKQNPCWQYWRARAYEKNGKPEKAKVIYEMLAESRQYYGFLASMRLHKPLAFHYEPSYKQTQILKPYQSITWQIASLYRNKQKWQAARLLNDFILELPKAELSALIAWIGDELQWYGRSVYLSDNEKLMDQLSLRFPLPFNINITRLSAQYHLPAALIYAIIRQESGFREDVVSSAGARGLMQLMPATASQIASSQKISYTNKDQLFLADKNISIGTAYLKHLSRHYSGEIIWMAAAYNAGPTQVNHWLKNEKPRELDIWIESLPWRETRNYIKNVVAFYAVYQYRLNHKSDLASIMKLRT